MASGAWGNIESPMQVAKRAMRTSGPFVDAVTAAMTDLGPRLGIALPSRAAHGRDRVLTRKSRGHGAFGASSGASNA